MYFFKALVEYHRYNILSVTFKKEYIKCVTHSTITSFSFFPV